MKTVNPSVRNVVNLKHRDAEKERVKLMEKDLGGTVQLQGIWDPWQRFVIGAGSARVLTAVNAQAARMGNTHRLCCSDLLQWWSAPGYTHMQSALGV